MLSSKFLSTLTASAALLFATSLPPVLGHGGEEPAMSVDMSMPLDHTVNTSVGPYRYPEDWAIGSYFAYEGGSGLMYAHIASMILAGTIVLPIAVFLSAARSPRYAIPAQIVFVCVNIGGLLCGGIYSENTPDLYPHNAHSRLGWAVLSIALVWVVLGLVSLTSATNHVPGSSHPMTSENMAQYQRLRRYDPEDVSRISRESGSGTEARSDTLCASSRNNSADYVKSEDHRLPFDNNKDAHAEDLPTSGEKESLISSSGITRFIPDKILQVRPGRTLTVIKILYVVLERSQILLGFLAITTGLVTWWGIFHPSGFLNGLAHWVKGGIFFWYGLLTLGRWMGAFTDFGWAWNVRPQYPLVTKFAARVPSAELTESSVILLYGASNVFLEHLGSRGKPWEAIDYEHVSITILFIGGGLLGVLIEVEKVRDFLNYSIMIKHEESVRYIGTDEAPKKEWDQPKTYTTSLNPMPGLVIVLLGLMMSSHHQNSMISTMMHAQWGMLFVGFGLARAVTYILMYLCPPTSHFPSRPPSEIVAAFCLCAGGLLFMGSTRDVVILLEGANVDAMFVFNVTMGLTSIVMAWAVALYALKGWASRREARRAAAE